MWSLELKEFGDVKSIVVDRQFPNGLSMNVKRQNNKSSLSTNVKRQNNKSRV